MKRIVVFVSGKGSNARNIHQYFKKHLGYGISSLISNNDNSELKEWCSEENIPFILIDSKLKVDDIVIWDTAELQLADIVVLAGFLKKIPPEFIKNIDAPIINIHPSLLPLYGGKGMYGMHVHEAVLEQGDSVSGITIHYVNNQYDEGKILFQLEVDISVAKSASEIQEKVQKLEYEYYPKVIRELLDI